MLAGIAQRCVLPTCGRERAEARSRTQISAGLGRRRFVVRRNNFKKEFARPAFFPGSPDNRDPSIDF